MTKAEEILEKHLKNNLDQRLYLRSSRLTYNLCLDALNEAINYTQCCEKLKDEKGVDLTQGFVEALVFERILTKKGSYFRYQDTNIAQGMKNLRLVLDNSPELLENLKADLDELYY